MQQSILTINAGSSSVKFALFELAEQISEKAAISGQIDGIGTAHVRLVAKDNTGTRIVDQALPAGADHATSFDQLLHWFSSSAKGGKIVAVGHRVVHGGDRYSHPVVLSAVDQIEDLTTALSNKIWQKIMILDRPLDQGAAAKNS